MQHSRLEELARQSPQLNDGVRRILIVEFATGRVYYRLEETYHDVNMLDLMGEFGVKRKSIESVSNQDAYGPFVELVEFGFLRATKPSPRLKSVLIEPAHDTLTTGYGALFSLHYIEGSLVDATFKAHSQKFNAGIRVIPPMPGKPVRVEIMQSTSHTIDIEDLTTEECITSETQGKEVVLPYSWSYEGSTLRVEESGGSFQVTVAEPGFRSPRKVSFPVSLDAKCNAFFELGNTEWLYAPKLFRISREGGF